MSELIRDWFLDPMALLFLISLFTIVVMLYRGGRAKGRIGFWRPILVIGWLMVFLVSSSPALVNPLLASLEAQYPRSLQCETGSHLVVLGGGVDSSASSDFGFELMSDSTMSRASAAVRIAENEPSIHLIAAGRGQANISEADVISRYWIALGIDPQRIVKEEQSMTTRENAENVAQLLSAQSVRGPVRLLTSARHMPRALASFRKLLEPQRLAVCPVSVDIKALSEVPWWALMPQTTALLKFDMWLYEILASWFYRLQDWI